MSGTLLSRARVRFVVFFVLSSPLFWLFGREPLIPEPSAPAIATMPHMDALVPTLVAMGWENFFLDFRQSLKLSPEQAQHLYLIRQKYLSKQDDLEKALAQAQPGLFRNLGEDVVSSSKLESDLKQIAHLKVAISALHFRAELAAINVLDHRQHLRVKELLKLRLQTGTPVPSGREVMRYRISRTLRPHLLDRPQRPSNFTPRELWWKRW